MEVYVRMKRIINEVHLPNSFEEAAFSSLFTHPEISVFTTTLTGKFLKISKGFCQILGFTEEELFNISLTDITYPDDLHQTFLDPNFPIQEKKHYTVEKRLVRKDQSTVWLNLNISLIPNFNQYLCLVQDLSYSKYREMEFRDTKEILESIYDTTKGLIAYLDVNFNFIRVNKKYATAGGHPPEFYIGKNHFDLYPYEENEVIFRRVVETGQAISYSAKPFEYKEYPELGITYWDWDLIPVKDSMNTVTGLIFSLVDVTERKKAEDELRKTNERLEDRILERTSELQAEINERKKIEKALRQSEQRYREVFENTSDGIFLIDITNDKRFKLAGFNPSKEKMLGIKSSEAFGKYVDEVFLTECSETAITHYRRCYELGNILNYEECLSLPKGNVYFYTTLIPVQNDEGVIYRILGVCRDITEYREMSESLRRAKEEAECANNAKSEYIANMSHELRTPINVILSAIQLFDLYLKSTPPLKSDKPFNHLKSMKQNCLRLLRLVNNLIDTTKLDSNFYEINLKNHDIVNIIEIITLSVMDYVKNRNIELTFNTFVERKIIACDIDIIERIMLNLLSNAIKFTQAGGTIQVSVIDRGEKIIISVKDNGIGIPLEKQKTIFDRYKQVDQLLTRKHEGSGIGLSLTKSFVELLDGNITVNSAYGLGSEFTVELPCKVLDTVAEESEIRGISSDHKIIEKIIVELSDIYTIKEIK